MKKIHILYSAIISVAILFVFQSNAKAAPSVVCSDRSHSILAVNNSSSGDGKQINVSCISNDSQSQSNASVGSDGADLNVVCQNNGTFVTSTKTSNGKQIVSIVCTQPIVSYFNGQRQITVGDNAAFDEGDLDNAVGQPGGAPPRNLQAGEIDCEITPLNSDNCEIIRYIVVAINFLSALAGIVFVLSIMIAGFQYMTGRDNAGQIQKAKSRIVMTLVALAIFIFMYAFLNFLVPGGVLPT